MTPRRRWLTAAYAALSVADTALVGVGPRGRRLHHVVKPLLMPVLAAGLAGDTPPGPVVRRVLAAQGLSWGGDVALMGRSESRFLAGVASFLGAHVAYVAAFRALGSGSPTASAAGRGVLALASVAVPANAVLAGRRDARFGVPVGAYGLVLAAMAASAAALPESPERTRVRAGAALFLTSDSLLGVQLFLRDEPHPALESAVMATYTAAQWLISDGVSRSVG
ncbi:lysoplasmalogenase [Nocardioides sp.]|uniref:lysoplasmalogenase n=1 Tax=Nocardioides sp. TaxID=35761 RepID=UPI001A2872CD|nr:lysoplasmalogenase [Nocardioides sp.]MBJ7356559.1 lysoplasmalogenase [Nocardioides sp.]